MNNLKSNQKLLTEPVVGYPNIKVIAPDVTKSVIIDSKKQYSMVLFGVILLLAVIIIVNILLLSRKQVDEYPYPLGKHDMVLFPKELHVNEEREMKYPFKEDDKNYDDQVYLAHQERIVDFGVNAQDNVGYEKLKKKRDSTSTICSLQCNKPKEEETMVIIKGGTKEIKKNEPMESKPMTKESIVIKKPIVTKESKPMKPMTKESMESSVTKKQPFVSSLSKRLNPTLQL